MQLSSYGLRTEAVDDAVCHVIRRMIRPRGSGVVGSMYALAPAFSRDPVGDRPRLYRRDFLDHSAGRPLPGRDAAAVCGARPAEGDKPGDVAPPRGERRPRTGRTAEVVEELEIVKSGKHVFWPPLLSTRATWTESRRSPYD